jgi:transposase
VAALTGRFDEHHAFVARMLLDQIDALDGQIQRLTTRIEQAIAAIPAASPPAPDPGGGHGAAAGDAIGPARSVPGHIERVDPQTGEILAAALPVVDRLDEVAGIGRLAAQVIIAEVGLDMAQFPTPGQLVSWARLSPRTIQSGATRRAGATGHGNPYLKAALGEAATAAAKTNTFLGERYRRLVKRIGKRKALVAIARSILVIVWHLLADPTARFHDLGADYYANRIDTTRKTRNLVRQLEALGHKVTLQPAA